MSPRSRWGFGQWCQAPHYRKTILPPPPPHPLLHFTVSPNSLPLLCLVSMRISAFCPAPLKGRQTVLESAQPITTLPGIRPEEDPHCLTVCLSVCLSVLGDFALYLSGGLSGCLASWPVTTGFSPTAGCILLLNVFVDGGKRMKEVWAKRN